MLYRSPTPAQYVAWLRDLGVRDVFVPRAALDQDSAAEPGLIARSGAFVLVHRAGAWSVYRLRDPSPLVVAATGGAVTAPAAVGATVTAIGHDAVTIAVARPGRYVIKVTWTPYLRLAASPGGSSAPPGGLAPASGDWACCAPTGRAGTCWRCTSACARRWRRSSSAPSGAQATQLNIANFAVRTTQKTIMRPA